MAVALSWCGLVVYWLIARRAVKQAVTAEGLRERAPYSILASLGTIWVFLGAKGIPHPRAMDGLYIAGPAWLDAAGAVMTIAGAIFAIWARATLGRNWSARILIKKDHSLIDDGPYRWVRHPIYAGILLMMTGTVAVLGTTCSLPGLLLVFAAAVIKAGREEVLLKRHFPGDYQIYSRKVKRLLPLIW